MRLQEYIEEAMQDILQARTYISTNSIVVARRTERELTKGQQFVEVTADGADRQSNNHDKYMIELAVQAVTKVQEDINGVDLDALWSDVSTEMTQTLTTTTLQAAINAINASSNITIDGIDNLGEDVQTLEQYEYREQRVQLAVTYSP